MQPEVVQAGQTLEGAPPSWQAAAKSAPTQQALVQVAPMGQAAVVWQVCAQLPLVEEQARLTQVVLSGQSAGWAQSAVQRGWLGSVVEQPCPMGQSEALTQPSRQLYEPSAFPAQI